MRSQALRDKRKALVAANETLLAAADARDDKLMTAEEKTAFDANIAQIKSLGEDIQRIDTHDALQAELATLQPRAVTPTKIDMPTEALTGAKPFKLPATARRVSSDKLAAAGFRGPDAERDAYTAGVSLAAQIYGHARARTWCREHGIGIDHVDTDIGAVSGMNEGSNIAGGVLVIPEVENAVIVLRQEFGVFRRYARNVTMASEVKSQPRKTGGLQAYPVGEGASGTESTSAWDSVQLVARTWQIQTRYSDELNEDAMIDLAADIATDFAAGFAYSEDLAGFLGDGTSTYHGIKGLITRVPENSTNIITAASGGTAFTTLVLGDFENMAGTLPRIPGIAPKWFFSQLGYWTSLGRLKYAVGGNTKADLESGIADMALGAGVVISQVLNATAGAQASTYVGFYGDLSKCAKFGDRRGITIKANPYEYMNQRQVSIYATERFDINIANIGDSSAAREFPLAGPVLILKTAAS